MASNITDINSFICTNLNGFKYCYFTLVILFNINGFKSSKWLNSFIWPIDGTQTGATTPGQSRPGSNNNKGVLNILQSSRSGASPTDAV